MHRNQHRVVYEVLSCLRSLPSSAFSIFDDFEGFKASIFLGLELTSEKRIPLIGLQRTARLLLVPGCSLRLCMSLLA